MPTSHHMKMLPVTLKEFVKNWGYESQTKAIITREYDKYLKANKHQHHYGNTTGIDDWSRIQGNSYKSCEDL